MDIKRTIRFGAAAVIANGVLALTAFSPRVALANPCADQEYCAIGCPTTLSGTACQVIAKPGCTATAFNCLPGLIPPCAGSPNEVICQYQ
jgi:hypothetical protein